MSHKEIAVSFLKMAGMGYAQKAFDQFVDEAFIHHNQYFKGDRQSLLDGMVQAHESSPNLVLDVKKVYEDGDTVITHTFVKKEHLEIAVMHVFRFKNDKIAELWDVGHLVDQDSPNEHGLF